MKKYLTISALLHVILITLAVVLSSPKGCGTGDGDGKGKGDKEQGSNSDELQGEIVAKKPEAVPSKEPEMSVYSADEVLKPSALQEAEERYTERDCPGGSFGGIGVEISIIRSSGGFVLSRVVSGYPASKAGIKSGDILLERTEIRGEPGTDVTVQIVTPQGETKNVTMLREKICLDSPAKGAP